ncbi:MAG: cell wall hydrolase [Moraxellaceae bacterium]
MTTPIATKPEPLSELTYLALCVYDEARGEPFEGQVAVARVVLNRTAKRYASDGTIRGTVLSPNQFSGFYFDSILQAGGKWKYVKVANSVAGADVRARQKFAKALGTKAYNTALQAARDALSLQGAMNLGKYTDRLSEALHYLNPRVLTSLPSWANKGAFIKSIGQHDFYRAPSRKAASK